MIERRATERQEDKEEKKKESEKKSKEGMVRRVECDAPVGIRGGRITAAGRRRPSGRPSSAPG